MKSGELFQDELPSVSIIMPTYNEAAFIQRSLESVLRQDYPQDLIEVIIADGQSNDDTLSIIQGIAENNIAELIDVIDNPDGSAASGLNKALCRAAGDVIIRVDAHTEIASDYVRQCVTILRSSGADNVGGCTTAVGTGRFGKAVALATGVAFGNGNARFRCNNVLAEEFVDTVPFGAWQRSVFDRHGLFLENIPPNEDDEFNYRLRAGGGRILLSPKIRSRYYSRSSPKALWKQYFRYGLVKVRVLQIHPQQMRLRQFVAPTFVAVVVLCLAIMPFSSFGYWSFSLVLATYMMANFTASFSIVVRKDSYEALPFLPIVFPIVHTAYGCGFLIGLVRYWKDWWAKKPRNTFKISRPMSGERLDRY